MTKKSKLTATVNGHVDGIHPIRSIFTIILCYRTEFYKEHYIEIDVFVVLFHYETSLEYVVI